MTGHNTYPTPEGENPFKRVSHHATGEAQAIDDPVVTELSDSLGGALVQLGNYQAVYAYREEFLGEFEEKNWVTAGVDAARYSSRAQLPRLHVCANDTLWQVRDLNVRYANERHHELLDQVAALSETASGVEWVAAPERDIERLIAARAPEGSDAYWRAGEPIEIRQRYNVTDVTGDSNHPEHNAYYHRDNHWARQTAAETGYWDVTKYVIQPVQYFSASAATYPESQEGEIQRAVDRLQADPHYESQGEEAHDKALIKVIFRAERLGIDGLPFSDQIVGEKRRSQAVVEVGISRQDTDVVRRGIAMAAEMPLDDQKRNHHLRGLVKIIAQTDTALAAEVTGHISTDAVHALALIDIAKQAETEEAPGLLERAKQVANISPRQGRSKMLGKMLEATLEFDEDFARALLPEMSDTARAKYEKFFETTDTPTPTGEIAPVDGQERELTIAESLLEQYRESGDHEILVKALAAGGLVKNIRGQQQLFNRIADELTDPSMPTRD